MPATSPPAVPDAVLAPGVVPVIVMDDADHAADLGQTLLDNGLPIAEITLRTEAGVESIRRMREIDGLHVGAGTVLSEADARRAVDAGATFLVSPGIHEDVVAYGAKTGVPVIPGVMTPSEIARGMALGLGTLKFFPAGNAGGPSMLKALASVYPDIRFMPTGGVTPDNLGDYLALPAVAACGGSWMTPRKLLEAGDFAGIGRLVREAVDLAKASKG